MYAVIERYRVHPDHAEQLLALIDRVVAEALAHQLGFVEYDAVRTTDDGVLTILVFETREQAERMERLSAQFDRTVVSSLEAQPVWEIEGDVIVRRDHREQAEA